MGHDWQAVQEGICDYLGTDISLLNDVNRKLLSHSGKQLRPVLSLLVARACSGGYVNSSSIKYAVASELLHNATLLHDDVADESDERRGNPTLRKLMGPSVSVLVGDFWLTRAVKAIMDAEIGSNEAVRLFSRTLGDLAEGEMLQLQKAGECDTDFEDYLKIIYRKTASLFVSTCRTAALSVNAPADVLDAVSLYAEYIGYAFQMKDDIFDYAEKAEIGKPVGVDILEHKITLPLLCALDRVDAAKNAEIRCRIKNAGKDDCAVIAAFVRDNGGIEDAEKVLAAYVSKAVGSLNVLAASREKEILCKFAEYIAERKK